MALFIGIEGLALTEKDKKRLCHPQVAGVILFARNYQNLEQLKALCEEIHHYNLIISIDHEGGHVQRLKAPFTSLPYCATIGAHYAHHPLEGYQWAHDIGLIMAYELRQAGIDLNLAPILDLKDEKSSVINKRAFHQDPAVCALLSQAMRAGMQKIGMASVGKHFPGHGRIIGDSHLTLPKANPNINERNLDLLPFKAAVDSNIEGIMTAHIFLPEENRPASFAKNCLLKLRQWGFKGAIFSDDLEMQGAVDFYPNIEERLQACFSAGTDIALLCNNFSLIDSALEKLPQKKIAPKIEKRIKKLRPKARHPKKMQALYEKAKSAIEKRLIVA